MKKTAEHLFEVTRYGEGYWTGFEGHGGRKKDGEGQDKDKNRKDVARRRFQSVIDLTNKNFDVKYAKFITLTYRENVKDIERSSRDLHNWLKLVRRKLGDIRYLWVIQFQDKNERGAIHYHILLDYQPKLTLTWLNASWTHGITDIKAVTRVDNIGAYLGRYMARIDDRRLDGKKAYGHSRNLEYPDIITGKEAEKIALRLENENSPVYAETYQGKHVGEVRKYNYNLKRVNLKHKNEQKTNKKQ